MTLFKSASLSATAAFSRLLALLTLLVLASTSTSYANPITNGDGDVDLALRNAIPVPIPSRTIPEVGELSARDYKNGTCKPDFVWTVVMPMSTLGSTCCPNGYKGEQTIIFANLAGVFCCPESDADQPCAADKRKVPSTPVECPSPGKISGALCMFYYW